MFTKEVNKLRCKLCRDKIYSRFTYDFKYCRCGACFIDGGKNYCRWGGNKENIEWVKEDEEFINLSIKDADSNDYYDQVIVNIEGKIIELDWEDFYTLENSNEPPRFDSYKTKKTLETLIKCILEAVK
jgi:hypothetical protein